MSIWGSGWVSLSGSCTCVLAAPMNSIGLGFAHTALCSQHGIGPIAAADDMLDRPGNKGTLSLGPAAWMAQTRPLGFEAAPWASAFSSQTRAFAQGLAATRNASTF